MLATILFACQSLTIVSGSSVVVFDLTYGIGGLSIPSVTKNRLNIATRSQWTITEPSHELQLIDADDKLVIVPLTHSFGASRISDSVEFMSITPGSSFAARFGNAMLLPPSKDHRHFRLMAGLTDPASQCNKGMMYYADMPADKIKLNIQVSLIPSKGKKTFVTRGGAKIEETHSERERFDICTIGKDSWIPFEIYNLWQNELLAIAGVPNRVALLMINWSSFIDKLPSIQYSVYRSDDSEDIVARIILRPRDFIKVSSLGADVMLYSNPYSKSYTLGLSVLKHIGVFFDYDHYRIGLCYPI